MHKIGTIYYVRHSLIETLTQFDFNVALNGKLPTHSPISRAIRGEQLNLPRKVLRSFENQITLHMIMKLISNNIFSVGN